LKNEHFKPIIINHLMNSSVKETLTTQHRSQV